LQLANRNANDKEKTKNKHEKLKLLKNKSTTKNLKKP